MFYWNRRGGRLVGNFTPRQVQWIRDHVTALRDTLEEYRPLREVDHHFAPGSYATKLFRGYHVQPAENDAPPTSKTDMTPGLEQRALTDAGLVLSTLPATGSVVELPSTRYAWAWIWSLSDCRIHLGSRLGLDWWERLHSDTEDEVIGVIQSYSKVSVWLSQVIENLIDMAELTYPTVGG